MRLEQRILGDLEEELKNQNSECASPEVELSGFDPVDIIRKNGTLSGPGMLLEAKITRGGEAGFTIHEYYDIEEAELTEEDVEGDKCQSIYINFKDDSGELSGSKLSFIYEPPDYHCRTIEPFNRGDFSYLGKGFAQLDAVDHPDGGRVLFQKEPNQLYSIIELKQHGWKKVNTLPIRQILRWFPRNDIPNLTNSVEIIMRDLIGVDVYSASRIKQEVSGRLLSQSNAGADLQS